MFHDPRNAKLITSIKFGHDNDSEQIHRGLWEYIHANSIIGDYLNGYTGYHKKYPDVEIVLVLELQESCYYYFDMFYDTVLKKYIPMSNVFLTKTHLDFRSSSLTRSDILGERVSGCYTKPPAFVEDIVKKRMKILSRW